VLQRQHLQDYFLINGCFVLISVIGWLFWGDPDFLGATQRFLNLGDWRPLVRAFSNFSLYGFYALFLAAFLRSYRRSDLQSRRVVQAYLVAEILGAGIIARSLKIVLGRARPDAGLGDSFFGFEWSPQFHAFPSGHTVDIWTCAFFAGILIPRRWFWIGSGLVAVLVSLSRMSMNVHWPSDVLAGTVLGAGVSLLVARYWLGSDGAVSVSGDSSEMSATPPL